MGEVIKFPRGTLREKRRDGYFQADWPPVDAFWKKLYGREPMGLMATFLMDQLGPDDGLMLAFHFWCKTLLTDTWC